MGLEGFAVLSICACCAMGLALAAYSFIKLKRIKMKKRDKSDDKSPSKKLGTSQDAEEPGKSIDRTLMADDYDNLVKAGKTVSQCATTYLISEFIYLTGFIAIFGLIIYILAEFSWSSFWISGSYMVGAMTCMLAEYISMRFAITANVRTVKKARKTMEKAFDCAYRGGTGIGFTIVSLSVVVLTILLAAYKYAFIYEGNDTVKHYDRMFMGVSGYALGASMVSLFGRIGGGIFTKAADVGADLAGKTHELEEDDPRNPGSVADFVGDNVGDVGGTGSAFFAGISECSCATMLLSCSSPDLVLAPMAVYFPSLIMAISIPVTYLTQMISSVLTHADNKEQISRLLKNQPFTAAMLITPALFLLCIFCLPAEIRFASMGFVSSRYQIYICLVVGLWGGYLIGLTSEYFTSNDYYPVQEVARSCHTGSATDIIYGLALGYMSTIFPILILVGQIYVCYICAGLYGIAIGTMGLLSTLPIVLAVVSTGPIADNASGIAGMCKIELAKDNASGLHAAGKTISAHVRCFAVCGSFMIALALFLALVNRHNIVFVDVLQPIEFSGLILGAMLPYAFSAQILKSVCDAAGEISKAITDQLPAILKNTSQPKYQECVKICSNASLKAMVVPILIVVGSPLAAGVLFGPLGICGLLAGTLVSGVQLGISFVNSGVAWDNAMKYIEENKLVVKSSVKLSEDKKKRVIEEILKGKDSEEYKSAVIGDTVGDPMKATSGPAIGVLMKQTCMIALIFGQFFISSAFLGKMV